MGLEHGHGDPGHGEVLRRGDACRTGADDGDLPPDRELRCGQGRLVLVRHDEPLHVADRQRLVHVRADAGRLTQVVADPPEDPRHGIVGPRDRHGVVESSLADRPHVGGYVLVDWALVGTWRLDAVEEVERARRLGPMRAEGIAEVAPVLTNGDAVRPEVEQAQCLDDEFGQSVDVAIRHVMGACPGFDGSLDIVAWGGDERVDEGCGVQRIEVVGGHRLVDGGRQPVAIAGHEGGTTHEVAEVRRMHRIEASVEFLEVLREPQVATGLQEVRAHRDGRHARCEEVGHVEGVGATGERQQQVAAELLDDLPSEVGRHGVEGATGHVHHLVVGEGRPVVLDLEGVRELQPEGEALSVGRGAEVLDHGHGVRPLEVVAECFVWHGDVREAEFVVDDGSDGLGPQQGGVALHRGVQAPLGEEV